MSNTPVDFNNPEELEKELAAVEAETDKETTEKAAKPKKPRTVKVTYTADRDIKAGETIVFDYEIPKTGRSGVGVNAGIAIEDMNEAQLKIEYRNASSVLYKTKKAGRDTTAAQARLDKVIAAMQAKGIEPGKRSAAIAKIDASTIANLIKSGQVSVEDIQMLLDADTSADA